MIHEIELKTNKTEILKSYLKEFDHGGLFIKTDKLFGLGDKVLLKLEIAELQGSIHLNGTIAWHRRPRAWSSPLPSGIGIQFTADETSKLNFLLQFLARKSKDKRQTGPRKFVKHPLKLKLHNRWVSAETQDMGRGGLQLVCDEPLIEGSNIDCKIYDDDNSTPTECNIIVLRVKKKNDSFVAGAKFMRTTPVVKSECTARSQKPSINTGFIPPRHARLTIPYKKE